MKHLKKLATFSALLFMLACGSNGNEPAPEDNSKDRKVILTHLADSLIIPAYEDFQEVFTAMMEKANAFGASPDQTTLLAFREGWVNAYLEWQKVDVFGFGPADKYTLRNFFNIYPADVNGITTNLNDPSVSLDVPASYATQGFPALDYLLNGAADDNAILAAFTTDANAAERRGYLSRITDRMESLLTKVVSEWKGPYRDAFINSTGLDIGSSTGLVVNSYVLYYERFIRSGKIGIPSGTAIGSSGIPYPEKVEAYYKRDISLALAETAHRAAWDFFNGRATGTVTEGPSLKTYLDALGAKDPATGTLLSEIINNQFQAIQDELGQLSASLYQQIETDNTKMARTYDTMQKLVRILKVDMTSAMSVTITYTDNDGD